MFGGFKHLKIEVRGPIVLLRLGDGSRMNAMEIDGHAELPLFFREFQRLEGLSAAVVTGSVAQGQKPAFSVGGNLDLLRLMNADPDVRSRIFGDALELVRSLIDLDKPLVAAVTRHRKVKGNTYRACCWERGSCIRHRGCGAGSSGRCTISRNSFRHESSVGCGREGALHGANSMRFSDFGKPGSYFVHQVDGWTKQIPCV
jgi:hypothetical protein